MSIEIAIPGLKDLIFSCTPRSLITQTIMEEAK